MYEAEIHITFNLEKREIISCTSACTKLFFYKLIKDNIKDNAGFLMWISDHCTSCIFQLNSKSESY